jgi:hypothetical protein
MFKMRLPGFGLVRRRARAMTRRVRSLHRPREQSECERDCTLVRMFHASNISRYESGFNADIAAYAAPVP